MPPPSEPTPPEPDQAAADGGAPAGALRRFTDRRGIVWTVHEERFPIDSWNSADLESHQRGYGVGWLLFQSDGLTKCLRLYPANWRTIADPGLATLCARARRFGEPPRSD